ncbi:Hypothetical protein FKW44_020334 [Caligus rogercresseyi]|uniref:Uncharacterized protein n=1 Tax=Caligus rogercresseyi TaxID=217165 RepID=A0A7T8GX53_CALRO|nr:Hypothetical protein FKW44_020334 [Caligus rogercresseyi]
MSSVMPLDLLECDNISLVTSREKGIFGMGGVLREADVTIRFIACLPVVASD